MISPPPSPDEQRAGEEDEHGLDGEGGGAGHPQEEAGEHGEAQQDPQSGEGPAPREVQDTGDTSSL